MDTFSIITFILELFYLFFIYIPRFSGLIPGFYRAPSTDILGYSGFLHFSAYYFWVFRDFIFYPGIISGLSLIITGFNIIFLEFFGLFTGFFLDFLDFDYICINNIYYCYYIFGIFEDFPKIFLVII